MIFSKCVSIISPIIKKHNGYISKILSENIISLFPNHPSDAVNCYLEITEKLTEYANEEENNYFDLKKATGLHYGNILLGTIGEENRLDDTVISETVNVVSRLSEVAKTYNVDFVFSDEVFNIIRENKFDFAQLGITTIKGKSQPLSIYTCTNRQNDVWGGSYK
jgi:two-component system sensor histidine kinase ChiS